MILIIAVLAIALLIACAKLYALKQDVNEAYMEAGRYYDQWESELNASSALRNEMHHESERVMIAQEQVAALKQEIADIKGGFKNLIAEDDPQERGNHFRHRMRRKTTAETYRIVFDMDQHGQRVLEDLVNRFKRSPFTPDDQGGERETSRRIGHAEVVDFLINKVNVANSPNYNEALEIAYMEQNDE